MRILVTGGAGYIGSHTALELLGAGPDVVVVDNLSNSREEALRRVMELAGRPLTFHRVDLLDRAALDAVFAAAPVEAVIHFAALKAVGESVAQPLRYYRNNVAGAISLLGVLDDLSEPEVSENAGVAVLASLHQEARAYGAAIQTGRE